MDNKKTDLIYTDQYIESDDVIKTMVQFLQVSREFLKYHDACLRQKAGTSIIKFIVLMILENRSGKTSPSELARLSQTKRHNITALMRRMEKDGDIKIAKNKKDRRSLDVLLTEKGKETLANSYGVGKEIAYEIIGPIPGDDRKSFSSQLSFIMNNTRSAFQALNNDYKRKISKSKKE